MKSKPMIATGLLAVVSLVFLAALAGTYYGNQLSSTDHLFDQEIPITLKADSAAAGSSLSMATGIIDRDRLVEGLFVLDHLSGNLQCWVINPQNASIAGIYEANVNKDLGLGKGGDHDFVMVCGQIEINNSRARRGNNLPAGCVCYVGDGNTGKVVGYSFFYDRQVTLKGGAQRAPLEIIARGVARQSGLTRDN